MTSKMVHDATQFLRTFSHAIAFAQYVTNDVAMLENHVSELKARQAQGEKARDEALAELETINAQIEQAKADLNTAHGKRRQQEADAKQLAESILAEAKASAKAIMEDAERKAADKLAAVQKATEALKRL